MKKDRTIGSLRALGARWRPAGKALYCIECGELVRPLTMTPHQLDIWDRTGLCRWCQRQPQEL